MVKATPTFSHIGVTIVLPVFNPGSDLDVSLTSALRQTHPTLEVLVIDDGSTSQDWAMHPALRDERVRVLHQAENLGVARARNRAVREASHALVALLDQDDAWEATKVERQVAAMHSSGNVSLCSTGFVWHLADGSTRVAQGVAVSYAEMLDSGMINLSSVMTRRDLYLDVGGCDPTLTWAQDHDLMLKLLHGGTHVAIPDALTHYYLHDGNRSRKYRGSVAFRRSVLARHGLRAKYAGDLSLVRASRRGDARAWELYSAQAFDAARRSRRNGQAVDMGAELARWGAGRLRGTLARRGDSASMWHGLLSR